MRTSARPRKVPFHGRKVNVAWACERSAHTYQVRFVRYAGASSLEESPVSPVAPLMFQRGEDVRIIVATLNRSRVG